MIKFDDLQCINCGHTIKDFAYRTVKDLCVDCSVCGSRMKKIVSAHKPHSSWNWYRNE